MGGWVKEHHHTFCLVSGSTSHILPLIVTGEAEGQAGANGYGWVDVTAWGDWIGPTGQVMESAQRLQA